MQYSRTLFVARPLTLKYTADVVPLALEFEPTQIYLVGGQPLVNPGGALHAAGANPIGFQANIGSRRIQPFGSSSLGFLHFNRPMPVIGSSQFNYNITIGLGAQFFPRSGRSFTVGWKISPSLKQSPGALQSRTGFGRVLRGVLALPGQERVALGRSCSRQIRVRE